MAGGRPLKFQSVEELEQKVADYFAECDSKNIETLVKPYTITGLAYALGCDRDTLLNYEQKEEFFGTVKKAKLKIHSWTEEYLFTGKNQTGAIFNLKNNYGWKDKTESETTLITPNPIIQLNELRTNDSNE